MESYTSMPLSFPPVIFHQYPMQGVSLKAQQQAQEASLSTFPQLEGHSFFSEATPFVGKEEWKEEKVEG